MRYLAFVMAPHVLAVDARTEHQARLLVKELLQSNVDLRYVNDIAADLEVSAAPFLHSLIPDPDQPDPERAA